MSLKNGTYYVSHIHKKIIKIRQIKVPLTLIFKLGDQNHLKYQGLKALNIFVNFKDQYILVHINQALTKLMRDTDRTTEQNMFEWKEMVSQVRVMYGNYT